MVQMDHTGKGSFYIHKPENKSNKEYQDGLTEALDVLTDTHHKKIYDKRGYDELQKVIGKHKISHENADKMKKENEEFVKKLRNEWSYLYYNL
jgi:DnaJ-class molecular chaperone